MTKSGSERLAISLMVIWYLVGVLGFTVQQLRPLFQQLTPYGMVASVGLMLYFQEPKNLKHWLVFGGIAVGGFVVELIGVNTAMLFGHYTYGDSLGIQIWNTPITIAINWLVLVYCISAVTIRLRDHWYFPLIGATAMVAFDWLMEPVAVATGLWTWQGDRIPVKNYLDWFLISGFLFLMIRVLRIEINNRIAGVLLLMQLVFFAALNLLIRTSLW